MLDIHRALMTSTADVSDAMLKFVNDIYAAQMDQIVFIQAIRDVEQVLMHDLHVENDKIRGLFRSMLSSLEGGLSATVEQIFNKAQEGLSLFDSVRLLVHSSTPWPR